MVTSPLSPKEPSPEDIASLHLQEGSSSGTARHSHTGNGPMILVVDDSRVMRRLIRTAVETLGFKAIEAEHGGQALELLHIPTIAQDIEAIIIDHNMPVKTGIETIELIKQLPAMALVPIMMVTSETERDIMAKGFALGIQDYLLKPFAYEELLTKITEILTSHAH
ncbi:MAG: response regulator [Vampirovibrionales bacterium]